ncbi:uncharacterized protein B0H64DRAFT_363144 [Chaetomium fimeti]|uniref:Fungal N-terminal domain-containing protein n=1 Tax=Chaetomium fimeti TaxID=1854472 RepID=A0AAE0HAR5_9PEZI|nr:hypothetical protein B0H64DRAFT_363144 [Chaetomium fimeti]
MDRAQMPTIARPIEYLLSGISSTSAIITRFIRSVRVAHADLAAVTRDLSDLRLILELLRDEPGIPLVLQAQMLLVLESCGNTLIHIDTILARCSEPTRWIDLGRVEILSCRSNLTRFREALTLALDVASLAAWPDGNLADADAIRDKINSEVQRLHAEPSPTQPSYHDTKVVISPYLDVISDCIQSPVGLTNRSSQDSGTKIITLADEKGNFEPGTQTTHINHDVRNSGGSWRTHDDTGLSWSQPNNGTLLSYYTEEPSSLSPLQEDRNASPGLPESPTLPGREGRPLPIPQRSLPPPLTQPGWKHGGSVSMRSEPPMSPGNMELESPTSTYSQDRPQDAKEGYFHQDGRVRSFASRGSGGSSSGSIPRASFNMTPVSEYRSGSISPGFEPLSASAPIAPSPFPSSPPPEYRRTWINAPTSAGQFIVPAPARPNPNQPGITVTPKRHLTDKSRGSEVLHIDTSPTSSYVATKHSNKLVKIWSISKNALHGTIKITSYVQPRVRSREYFIRSHAILSENATLIGITTHFGLTLEIWNFAKGGSGAKKIQVIDEAHRWAASQRDAFHNDYAGLAVYRPKYDRIDRFFLSRLPNTKTPFRVDPNHSIELLKSNLPFVPKFPELAYSSDSPILIAAAGPRPGDPPRPNSTILIAWHMKPVSDNKLHAQTPEQSYSSLPDEERHKPYRVCVPGYPALQSALPASLASHGSTAVSIWIPASTGDTTTPLTSPSSTTTPTVPRSSTFPFTTPKPKPPHPHPDPSSSTPAPDRLVLTWDLPTNSTRLFTIPAGAQAAISSDCARVAYCDASGGVFGIIDVASAAEVWRWPDAARSAGFASFGQLEGGLRGVTVFEFSADGKLLVVGDAVGGVGVYEVGDVVGVGGEERFELGVGSEVAWVDVVDEEIGRVRARRGLGG